MKKIVVVEDDPAMQDAIGLVFDPAEYTLTVISDPTLVLEDEYEIPDLFILDKQLSGVDGLDICRYLKANEKTGQIPVIMISASPDIVRLATEAGAVGAIEKPFNLKMLREMVESSLRENIDS